MTEAAKPQIAQESTAAPIWHRPTVSTLSLSETLFGAGSGGDGGLDTFGGNPPP
jgi:hypothetical protein